MNEQKKKKRDLPFFSGILISVILATLIAFNISVILRMEAESQEDSAQKQELFEQRDENRSEADSLQATLDTLHVLSIENVEYWIDTLGIQHRDVVFQQIMLETGTLISVICRENHNLFGMKEPRVRQTTALGTKRGHAYYSNYIDSIKDYKLWQDSMYKGGDYYAFLSRVGYAEAIHYISALKNI